jgi:hypothetical protein
MNESQNQSQSHVTVNERMPSVRFHRFVEEKVKDWIREHDISATEADFEVAFFDEEALGETSCLVIVHSGDHLWRSWETADNPRTALSRSLDHLREDVLEESLAEGTVESNRISNTTSEAEVLGAPTPRFTH